jgi:hypothetical protein
MRYSLSLLLLCSLAISAPTFAQRQTKPDTTESGEDLLKMLEDEDVGTVNTPHPRAYTTATFKATRIINGHSVENVAKGVLDFRISHRFGAVNEGAKNFFGLDNAVTKLAFDYGVTNWLAIGIGRGTLEKEFDAYIKAKLYRQTEDGRHPFTLSYVAATSIQGLEAPQLAPGQEYYFSNRLHYIHQLLIARKFGSKFSLQLTPTYIHYNLVRTSSEPNNTLALGLGGRLKLSNRIALTGEYYYRLPDYQLAGYHNSLSIGLDIETGGHVFQLFFTNSRGITERTFIGQTTDDWGDGALHFGFNISRVFTIVRPKGFEGSNNKIW